MPAGIPVATVAIGNGRNAGLLGVRILAARDEKLHARLVRFTSRLARESRAKNRTLHRD
jgi:5-(carboxyamino)imidazole ribonucleotide mutase